MLDVLNWSIEHPMATLLWFIALLIVLDIVATGTYNCVVAYRRVQFRKASLRKLREVEDTLRSMEDNESIYFAKREADGAKIIAQADRIKELESALPKWTSVRDRLPEPPDAEVVLLDKQDNIFRGICKQVYPLTIDFWMYPSDFEKLLPHPGKDCNNAGSTHL